MSEVRVNNLSNENNTGGPTISGITTYSGRHFFVPPQGDTASRPSDCEPGSFRFNTDTKHLEYFRGNTIGWVEVEAEPSSDVLGGGTGSNTGLGHRGVLAGGYPGPSPGSYVDLIDFITISTLGNSQDFGDMPANTAEMAAFGSRTRGVTVSTAYSTHAQYITFASTGYVTSFGTSTQARTQSASFSNSTRGIQAGGSLGYPNFVNTIDYYTIAQTGNAVDFGDLASDTRVGPAGLANTTRGIIACGYAPAIGDRTNRMDFVTISTTGNSNDFGDNASKSGSYGFAGGNSTRGILAAGTVPSAVNNIDFFSIATTGNTQDFGDLTRIGNNVVNGAVSDPTRMCCMGGGNAPGFVNTIDFIQIATTGNAKDFGDIQTTRDRGAGMSTGHGGL